MYRGRMLQPQPDPARAPEDRLPWTGRPRRVDILCWLGIVLAGAYGLALLPAVPSLIGTHPVLLELLRGSTSSMVAAGAFARVGDASLLLALLAAVIGMVKFDALYWWAGRLWGPKMIDVFAGRSDRVRRNVARVEKHAARFGWLAVILAPFLPIPTVLIYAAVGWTGMGLVRFLLFDVIGACLWGGLSVALGYAIGQSAVDAAKTISHYALWISLGLVALVFAQQIWRSRRAPAA